MHQSFQTKRRIHRQLNTPLPNTALSWPRPVQNSPGNTRPGAQPVQNSPRNIPPAPQPVQNSPNNTPPAPQPVQNSPGNTPPAPQPVQNTPNNTRPGAQPVQNSPSNTPPAPQPVQNSPSTHKISKIQPFWTCRANFLSLLELTQPAGRTFSRIRRHSTQHTHSPSPNRYKTRPATPHQHPNRYKTHPATPHQHPNRYKTRPAHTKSAKFSHFGHAGRTFSRSWS